MGHAQKWDKAWRVWDGAPLRGESVYFDPTRVFRWKGAAYPTTTSMDLVVDAVRRMSKAFPDIAGVEGVDWIALYLSPSVVPGGKCPLTAPRRATVHWIVRIFRPLTLECALGGELLVAAASLEPATHAGDEPWISEDENDDADDAGIATCVSPRPNRLVLIGPDRPHRIARIDQNAGAHLRVSIAGFFLRQP